MKTLPRDVARKCLRSALLVTTSTLLLSAGANQAQAITTYTCANIASSPINGTYTARGSAYVLLTAGDVLTFTAKTSVNGVFLIRASTIIASQTATPAATYTFTYTVPKTGNIRFTIHRTAPGKPTVYTVGCNVPAASTTTTTIPKPRSKALQASLSATQSAMTTTNVAQHLQGFVGGPRSTGSTPTASTPSASAPTASTPSATSGGGTSSSDGGTSTGGTGTSTNNEESQTNFSSTGAVFSPTFGDPVTALRSQYENFMGQTSQSQGVKLRDMLTMFNFDTSNMAAPALQAAQDATTTDAIGGHGAIGQRRLLDALGNASIWGYGSYSTMQSTATDGEYTGNSAGYTLGGDVQLSEKLVLGVALGYSDSDITTTYNSGTHDETAWNISPYVSYRLTDNLSYTGLVGASIGTIKNSRDNMATTGKTDTKSYSAHNALSYGVAQTSELPGLSATISHSYTHKETDDYNESDGTFNAKATTNTAQLSFKGEAAQNITVQGVNLNVFANSAFLHDLIDTVNDDANAVDVSAGLRFPTTASGWFGSVSGTKQFLRSDYSQWSVQGLIGYNLPRVGKMTQQASLQS
ncbi:MAG: autotransporter outer membrane beta-barrel domain-containing protein, partial [Magnetovibrio sp.]|nr:autotransporter outer membrane beta-barrel domain-containing protein [Magnetovibrio sp.]